MDTVGDRLRTARLAAGLSQQQLADVIGATRSAIAQVEGGITNSLNAENLAKAAKHLGKTAVWLATGEGPEDGEAMLNEVMHALPGDAQVQILDQLIYRIEKAAPAYIEQTRATSYVQMIEALKKDLRERKSGDHKD